MRRLTLVLVAVLALSLVAVAQDFPRAEVSAGYRYMRMQTGQPTSFNAMNSSGFGGGFSFNVHKYAGVVADFGWDKVTRTGRTDDSVLTALFGPEFRYRGESKLSPFAHVMAGLARCNDGYVVGTPTDPSITLPATTVWASAFGGGADLRLTDKISVRLAQVDHLRTHFAGYHQNNFRLTMGVVIGFGQGKTK